MPGKSHGSGPPARARAASTAAETSSFLASLEGSALTILNYNAGTVPEHPKAQNENMANGFALAILWPASPYANCAKRTRPNATSIAPET